MVNGLFIALVIVCHYAGQEAYYPAGWNSLDWGAKLFLALIQQMVVAPFLFYSGFGIMSSINKKGLAYSDSLAIRRGPRLLMMFEACLLLYIGAQAAIGVRFSWECILLSMTGWLRCGNPSWYIVMTVALYLYTALAFRLCGAHRPCRAIAVVALLVILTMALLCKPRSWWVNELMCFPAGMTFFFMRGKGEGLLRRSHVPAAAWGVAFILAAGVAYHFGASALSPFKPVPLLLACLCQNLAGVLFAVGVTCVAGCVEFSRTPYWLVWMGGPALFSLFMIHMLPARVLAHYGLNQSWPALYIGLSLAASYLLARLLMGLWKILPFFRGASAEGR